MKRYYVEMTIRVMHRWGFATRYKFAKDSYDKAEVDEAIQEQCNLVANVYEKGSSIIECRRWEKEEEEN